MEMYVAEDKNIEEIILGSILVDNKAIEVVLPLIKSSKVFFNVSSRVVFESALELLKNNIAVDLVTLSDKIQTNGKLEDIGGYPYLINLMNKISSTANLEHHVFILLQLYVQREVQVFSQVLLNKANRKGIDGLKLVEELKDSINEMENVLNTNVESNVNEIHKKILDDAIALGSRKENEVTGISSGINSLDNKINGWQNSDLIVLAARPAMGKTAFALNSLLTAAKLGNPVLIFSLEMSEKQLRERLVAMNSGFNLPVLKRHGIKSMEEITRMETALKVIEDLPIHIIDKAGMSIFDIIVTAKAKIRKHGIKMVIVDYIQLVSGGNHKENREQEISHISRSLKLLAKDMDVPVIALSQLSRAVENRQGHKRPMLSDLRESGAIEQDADQVLFLYRPDVYGMEIDLEMISEDQNTEIVVGKNRSGSTGIAGAYFHGEKVKFYDNNPINNFSQFQSVEPVDIENENPF